MIEPWGDKWVQAGCLDIPVLENQSLVDQWQIPTDVAALLRTYEKQTLAPLWKIGWIQLAFRTFVGSGYGRFRVYILPFDVDRQTIGHRDDEKYTKLLAALLRRMDYSSEAWAGDLHVHRASLPLPFDASNVPSDDDSSLLAMFNSVPSPDPQPSTIVDLDARDAVVSVMESNLPGLRTTLYPYQRRSAALMLQRELVPGRFVDPRLRHCRDQAGRSWYYDSVTGLVLREARYYDGTRGGILAEEMGTGKTLICLALVLSTRREPTIAPEPFVPENPPRRHKASLADMCAAAANRRSVPWQPYFDYIKDQFGREHDRCISALKDPANGAFFKIRSDPLVEPRRSSRLIPREAPTKEIHLGSGTLIIVPDNLVTQWREEIKKHTTGLEVLILVNRDPMPCVAELLTYDIVLFSQTRFDWVWMERRNGEGPQLEKYCPLEHIQWKRSIVDEGHKLGSRSKSSTSIVLEQLSISAAWIVTGTPTRNLYGVKGAVREEKAKQHNDLESQKSDLIHIGKMVSGYLKVRPWANTREDIGDTVADWNTYVMGHAQHSKGQNRTDSLKSTLNSLIVRHQLSEISTLLPAVDEKIVYLEGSYQDKMALNLFSMMIIFNAVQSQRTDMDYFFHPRQKKNLVDLVRNLRQACFYGGGFFSAQEIQTSVEIAEAFLKKKELSINEEDEAALVQAIEFGNIAMSNILKTVSNQFHSLPLYIENFPGGHGGSWALDGKDDNPLCIDAGLVLSLQKYLNPCIDAPTSLQMMIGSGRLDAEGHAKRQQALDAATQASTTQARSQPQQSSTLAGQAQLRQDHHTKPKSGALDKSTVVAINAEPLVADANTNRVASNIIVTDALASTRITSTVSAKMSYLIDAILQYKDDEQIIVFYDNDNIAWYLAGVLEILQVEHLIYTRAGLSAERRAQYVATFTHNPKFRVLLMDISQAAFGLDMRSASRIYFVSPVLNPQVQAQAIGRARRVSQQRPVTVETLVLKGSIDEVIVDRGKEMTQAEHRKVMSSVIEDKSINNWIRNVKIMPMDGGSTINSGSADSLYDNGFAQTAMLKTPQYVFGRGFGRELRPDDVPVQNSPESSKIVTQGENPGLPMRIPFKARHGGSRKPESPLASSTRETTPALSTASSFANSEKTEAVEERPRKKARVAWADE